MKTETKRILFVSEAHLIKRFLLPVLSKLQNEYDVKFDFYSTVPINQIEKNELLKLFSKVLYNRQPTGFISYIPKLRSLVALYSMISQLKKIDDYDIIHIFFHHYYYARISPILRKKTHTFYLTFFGSDFDQLENYKHKSNKKTIRLLDGVFATNPIFLDRIIKKYKLWDMQLYMDTLMFPMEIFDSYQSFLEVVSNEKAKKLMGFNNKIITCSYNGAPPSNHELMLEQLVQIKSSLNEFTIVFPMTYGLKVVKRREMVKAKILEFGINGIVLEHFLSMELVQTLRRATDIFVFIPNRDQMASSMLEHLAAGSVMITGKWLPFQILKELGVYYIEIADQKDLSSCLQDVINNLEIHQLQASKNKDVIFNIMNWNTLKNNWVKYYNLKKIK